MHCVRVDVPTVPSVGPDCLQLAVGIPLSEGLGRDSEELGEILRLDEPIIHLDLPLHVVFSLCQIQSDLFSYSAIFSLQSGLLQR